MEIRAKLNNWITRVKCLERVDKDAGLFGWIGWSGKFIVFQVCSPHEICWIPGFVLMQFAADNFTEGEAKVIGQFQQEYGDVGDFIGNRISSLADDLFALPGRFPDKMLQEFRSFSDYGDGHFFRAVKWPPFAFRHKFLNALSQETDTVSLG